MSPGDSTPSLLVTNTMGFEGSVSGSRFSSVEEAGSGGSALSLDPCSWEPFLLRSASCRLETRPGGIIILGNDVVCGGELEDSVEQELDDDGGGRWDKFGDLEDSKTLRMEKGKKKEGEEKKGGCDKAVRMGKGQRKEIE